MENEVKSEDKNKGGKKPWRKKPYYKKKKKNLDESKSPIFKQTHPVKTEEFHSKKDQYMWLTISRFQMDEMDSAFKFSDRLAKENGWTKEYTLRVIEEYKKFIYLCVTSPMCTPSDEVDQVWHMHMTYTESYKNMCNAVGRFIKHGPTKGGKQESIKYSDIYLRTLTNYKTEFGIDAPADIWPDVISRFEKYNNYQRVNMSTNWVIPKPKFRIWPFSMFCPFILMSMPGMIFFLVLFAFASVLLIRALINWAARKHEEEQRTMVKYKKYKSDDSGCANLTSGCTTSHSTDSIDAGFDGGDSGGGGSDSGCGGD